MDRMMFRKEEQYGLSSFHSTPETSTLVTRSFLNEPILFEQYKKLEDNLLFYKYNISNFGSSENIAIYLALLWRLSSNKSIYAITPYETENTARIIELSFETILWEYSLINEYTDTTKGHIVQNLGFKEAHSPPLSQQGKEIQILQPNETGIFHISTKEEFFDLPKAGFGDVLSEINIFALKEDRYNDLIIFLNQHKQPKLDEFLEHGDLFFAVNFGVESGFYDYVLVVSKENIDMQLKTLSQYYSLSAAAYEKALNSIQNFKELEQEIEKLLWPDYSENDA